MREWVHISQQELKDFLAVPERKRQDYGAEDTISMAFADALRKYSVDGSLDCVWAHIPNEFAGPKVYGYGNNLKQKGKIKGAPDYFFAGEGWAGFIEMKSPTGVLSPEQKTFQKWCAHHKVPYSVLRSATESLDALNNWGLLA